MPRFAAGLWPFFASGRKTLASPEVGAIADTDQNAADAALDWGLSHSTLRPQRERERRARQARSTKGFVIRFLLGRPLFGLLGHEDAVEALFDVGYLHGRRRRGQSIM